jgi:hypothetical protein
MDGHQHQALSDEMLEREIEAALGVEPSPEFLPRIRARIANERMHKGWFWSWSWRLAGAAAVVAAVAIVGLWTMRDPAPARREAQITSPVETTTPSSQPALPAAAPVASSAEAPKPGSAPVVRTASSAARRPVMAQPEILISPDESAALQQLFAAISSRRIETRALPDLASALKPPAPIEEIVLEPITISPLAAVEGE